MRPRLGPARQCLRRGALSALCIPIVLKDDQAPDEERDEQVRFYGDEAMKMLRAAVAKGYKNATDMKEDKDLDPLREREDFKRRSPSWKPGTNERQARRPDIAEAVRPVRSRRQSDSPPDTATPGSPGLCAHGCRFLGTADHEEFPMNVRIRFHPQLEALEHRISLSSLSVSSPKGDGAPTQSYGTDPTGMYWTGPRDNGFDRGHHGHQYFSVFGRLPSGRIERTDSLTLSDEIRFSVQASASSGPVSSARKPKPSPTTRCPGVRLRGPGSRPSPESQTRT